MLSENPQKNCIESKSIAYCNCLRHAAPKQTRLRMSILWDNVRWQNTRNRNVIWLSLYWIGGIVSDTQCVFPQLNFKRSPKAPEANSLPQALKINWWMTVHFMSRFYLSATLLCPSCLTQIATIGLKYDIATSYWMRISKSVAKFSHIIGFNRVCLRGE